MSKKQVTNGKKGQKKESVRDISIRLIRNGIFEKIDRLLAESKNKSFSIDDRIENNATAETESSLSAEGEEGEKKGKD